MSDNLSMDQWDLNINYNANALDMILLTPGS